MWDNILDYAQVICTRRKFYNDKILCAHHRCMYQKNYVLCENEYNLWSHNTGKILISYLGKSEIHQYDMKKKIIQWRIEGIVTTKNTHNETPSDFHPVYDYQTMDLQTLSTHWKFFLEFFQKMKCCNESRR